MYQTEIKDNNIITDSITINILIQFKIDKDEKKEIFKNKNIL